MDTFLEVLKWTGLALAAGFVGYFGRHFAKLLIARINRNKEVPASEIPAVNQEPPATPEVAVEEARAKVEKKKSKAEAKRAKKSGG